MIALTIEQMKILQEKGLSPKFIHDNSSMMWVIFPNPHPVYKETNPTLTRLCVASGEYFSIDDFDYIPTFTLEDILKILRDHHEFHFNLRQYQIVIEDCTGEEIITYEDESYLLMAYNALVWCLDNKYIK